LKRAVYNHRICEEEKGRGVGNLHIKLLCPKMFLNIWLSTRDGGKCDFYRTLIAKS